MLHPTYPEGLGKYSVFVCVCVRVYTSSPSCAGSMEFSVSLSLSHHPSLPAGLLGCILNLYRANMSKSLLVGQHWCVHVQESRIEHHSRVCPCFSSSALQVLFILLEWFVRWLASGHTAVVL